MMIRLSLICGLMFGGANAQFRIVGGETANPSQFKYYTSLYKESVSPENFLCGASLIAPDMVLTAAHCDGDNLFGTNFAVVVGNTAVRGNGIVRRVRRRWTHIRYNPSNIRNDIMLLRLDRPVMDVPPVRLNFDATLPQNDNMLTAIGLGRLRQNGPLATRLQFVRVAKFDFEECDDLYSLPSFLDRFTGITEGNQLCAGGTGGEDTCQGDSGGPLVLEGNNQQDSLVGLTSYGRGCANQGFPGVYTRISGYKNWILNRLCPNSEFPIDECPNTNSGANPSPPAPSPPSSGGGGFLGNLFGSFCFSAENTVQIKDQNNIIQTISIKDLQIGNQVMVASPNTFETVYSFGHKHDDIMTDFLQIQTTSQSAVLEISPRHLIFNGKRHTIPASMVKVGTKLIVDNVPTEVKSIRIVQRKGVYAPLTPSGTILVNGFKASTFVSLNGKEHVVGFAALSHDWLSHLFEAPHRLACIRMGGLCQNESYNDEGISTWHARPLQGAMWLLRQNQMVQTIIFCLGIIIFVIPATLDYLLSVNGWSGIIITLMTMIVMTRAVARRKKSQQIEK